MSTKELFQKLQGQYQPFCVGDGAIPSFLYRGHFYAANNQIAIRQEVSLKSQVEDHGDVSEPLIEAFEVAGQGTAVTESVIETFDFFESALGQNQARQLGLYWDLWKKDLAQMAQSLDTPPNMEALQTQIVMDHLQDLMFGRHNQFAQQARDKHHARMVVDLNLETNQLILSPYSLKAETFSLRSFAADGPYKALFDTKLLYEVLKPHLQLSLQWRFGRADQSLRLESSGVVTCIAPMQVK